MSADSLSSDSTLRVRSTGARAAPAQANGGAPISFMSDGTDRTTECASDASAGPGWSAKPRTANKQGSALHARRGPKRPREEGGESGAQVAPLQTDFVTAGDLMAAASDPDIDRALEMQVIQPPQPVGNQHHGAQLEIAENVSGLGHDSGYESDAESGGEIEPGRADLLSNSNTIITASGAQLEDAPHAATEGEEEASPDVVHTPTEIVEEVLVADSEEERGSPGEGQDRGPARARLVEESQPVHKATAEEETFAPAAAAAPIVGEPGEEGIAGVVRTMMEQLRELTMTAQQTEERFRQESLRAEARHIEQTRVYAAASAAREAQLRAEITANQAAVEAQNAAVHHQHQAQEAWREMVNARLMPTPATDGVEQDSGGHPDGLDELLGQLQS